MGQAEQLAQAATELNKASTTYTNTVGQIERTSGFVSGLAAGLLNGKTAWSGNGSSAFETAWNKSYGDAKNVNTALGGTATSMSTLATTITDNLGPIQKYDALAEVDTIAIPQEGLAAYRQDLLSAQQDANTSLNTITTKAQSLAMTLSGDLSMSVGVCSAGTTSVPLSPTMTATGNYWTGFLSGVLAQEMADANKDATAGANADATTTAGDETCPAPTDPNSGITPQQEQRQLTAALVIGALIAAGGSTLGSEITGGTALGNAEVGTVAFLAYLVSPAMKDPIDKFITQMDQKCGFHLTPKAKSLLVSNIASGIRNSALTGLIGGRVIVPLINKGVDSLLHSPKQPTPTPTPTQNPTSPLFPFGAHGTPTPSPIIGPGLFPSGSSTPTKTPAPAKTPIPKPTPTPISPLFPFGGQTPTPVPHHP